ncbi:MAG: hypothetical protein KAH12_02110, partial [Anaerolineales bacterium]|nr:hypothetical protein [Anaerolineales bacterium]
AAGEFIVIWQQLEGIGEFAQNDIWGRRVAVDGSLIGSAFAISPLPLNDISPVICSNPEISEYLVVWNYCHSDSNRDVYAQRLDLAGTKIGTLIKIADSSRDELSPDVSWDSTSQLYLTAWQEKQSNGYNIYGRLYQTDGTAFDSEFAIATWDQDLIKPKIACNQNSGGFLVVWEDHRWGWGAARDIYGQLLDDSGNHLGGNFAISWDGDNYRENPAVAYNATAGEYLVAWEYANSATDHDIYCGRVDRNGILRETDMAISSPVSSETHPALIAGEELSYLTVWEDGRNLATQKLDIYGSRFNLCRFSGGVFSGNFGDTGSPLAGVKLDLYGSNNSTSLGSQLDSRYTNVNGWYVTVCTGNYEYFNILEDDLPGYMSIGAASESGNVVGKNWIQFSAPYGSCLFDGNSFWDLPDPPPGGWVNFQPSEWQTSQTVDCTISVRDQGSGLAISSARYSYSNDAGNTWSNWTEASCSGAAGSTAEETISVVGVTFEQDSGVADYNLIKFRISDLEGHTSESGIRVVHIDTAAPELTLAPIVSAVTTNSASVSWNTSEEADSLVQYGATAAVYSVTVKDSILLSEHHLNLTELKPSTTYHLKVESVDVSGQFVESHDLFFQTQAAADEAAPSVAITDPGECFGKVVISSGATDDSGVERVEFYLDGKRAFTAYGPEYHFPLDTMVLENGTHQLTAKVFDLVGKVSQDSCPINIINFIDQSAPTVNIYFPVDGATLGGQINTGVVVGDDSERCMVEWFVDGVCIGRHIYDFSNVTTEVVMRYWWNTQYWANGLHRFAFKASDKDGKSTLVYADVYLENEFPQPKPDLVVEKHEIFRQGNKFTVKLTVRNRGADFARRIVISDSMQAFQPISSNLNGVNYRAEFDKIKKTGRCVIIDPISLNPRSSRTYTFDMVPILASPLELQPSLGNRIELSYWSESKYFRTNNAFYVAATTATTGTGSLPSTSLETAYEMALQEANYLIVTDPEALFVQNPHRKSQVNDLLSEMAQLAFDKHGVLGYLSAADRNTLLNLTIPNGVWAQKLHPDFRTMGRGYLLLVGETEIIPAWNSGKAWLLTWSNSNCLTGEVRNADLLYADTGGTRDPELVVGRIIGNNVTELIRAFKTSNSIFEHQAGYGFTRTNALLVSGRDSNYSDLQKGFINVVNKTADLISPEFNVKKLHMGNIVGQSLRESEFKANATDQDVIMFMGHGNPLNCCEIGITVAQGVDFGNTNPMILAWSCLTGSYENHTANYPCASGGGDYSFPETLFSRGAVSYIGSTEVSALSKNTLVAREFISQYWKPQTPAALALLNFKRKMFGSIDPFNSLWNWEYNFYGDPKFDVDPPLTTLKSTSSEVSEGLRGDSSSTVEIEIPDFTVELNDGFHYVDIPEGSLLLENGQYRVPCYVKTIDYSAGIRVQKVELASPSEPEAVGNFNLPINENFMMGTSSTRGNRSDSTSEWYPSKEYEWHTAINSDGSSTLMLTVYPFHYNGVSKEAQFCKNYSFNIETISTRVRAWLTRGESSEYAPGDKVTAQIEMDNIEEAQDVVFSGLVKRCGSEEVVDSLPLKTLGQLQGRATFAENWNSSGFAPGCYCLETSLKDREGNLLDLDTRIFNLGTISGRVNKFTASPRLFNSGDTINFSMTCENTGNIPLNGTAIIHIIKQDGEQVAEFSHKISDLPVAEELTFNDSWPTSKAGDGMYKAVAYILSDSRSSPPITTVVSTMSFANAIWQGFSSDWDDNGNWQPGVVPDIVSSVVISAQPDDRTWPVVNNSDSVARKISIESGCLTIEEGRLSVVGY